MSALPEPGRTPGRYALLFPGQGSQALGMGRSIRTGFGAARELFARASEVLGYDLALLCDEGPIEALNQTIRTQPALYVTSCAALDALRSISEVRPHAVAGHSVGEYAALYAAGALGFSEGLALVAKRAELMERAAHEHPGAMAAILGLDAEKVRLCCDESLVGGVVGIANFNCPGQIVISGEAPAVAAVCAAAKALGAARTVPLSVSGGFHSPLMAAVGDALYPFLRDAGFRDVSVPVVANVAAEYCTLGASFASYLTKQVSGSVRWEESVRLLSADQVRHFVELGSGTVLAGLVKRTVTDAAVVSAHDAGSLEAAAEMLRSLNNMQGE